MFGVTFKEKGLSYVASWNNKVLKQYFIVPILKKSTVKRTLFLFCCFTVHILLLSFGFIFFVFFFRFFLCFRLYNCDIIVKWVDRKMLPEKINDQMKRIINSGRTCCERINIGSWPLLHLTLISNFFNFFFRIFSYAACFDFCRSEDDWKSSPSRK